jgi:hypothetical protein
VSRHVEAEEADEPEDGKDWYKGKDEFCMLEKG